TRITSGSSYFPDVVVPVSTFGCGLALTVAPLTATALAAVSGSHSGLASGVNNAVARIAGLLAVAVLPLVAGLSGHSYTDPRVLEPAFRTVMWVCVALLLTGGLLAAVLVRAPAPAPRLAPDHPPREAQPMRRYCPVDGPPLAAATDSDWGRSRSSGDLGERPVGHRVDETAHLAPVRNEWVRRDARQRLFHIRGWVSKGLWCPSGSQAGVGLDLGFELVVGEGEHAAVSVVDEDDLPGPKESLTDDQGPNLVLGDDSASVANHVGVALAQAEQSVGVQ